MYLRFLQSAPSGVVSVLYCLLRLIFNYVRTKKVFPKSDHSAECDRHFTGENIEWNHCKDSELCSFDEDNSPTINEKDNFYMAKVKVKKMKTYSNFKALKMRKRKMKKISGPDTVAKDISLEIQTF